MKKTHILSTALLCALLTGCISDMLAPRADPTKFYLLDAPAQPKKFEAKAPVILSSVVLAGYLDRTQITTLGNGAEAKVSEFDRWVEPPEGMFSRNFARCIAENLGGSKVYLYPESPADPTGAVNVRITVYKCIGKIGGDLEFAVRWTKNEHLKNGSRIYAFKKTVPAGKGYDGYVNAIAQCVSEASASIAKSISE